MSSRLGLLLICALSARCDPVSSTYSRRLQQSNGPANTYGNAASATTADLVNDPAGRAHLLVRTLNLDTRPRLLLLNGICSFVLLWAPFCSNAYAYAYADKCIGDNLSGHMVFANLGILYRLDLETLWLTRDRIRCTLDQDSTTSTRLLIQQCRRL